MGSFTQTQRAKCNGSFTNDHTNHTNIPSTPLVSLLVCDGGSENNALSVQESLQISEDTKITKLIALKDIAFSNSPIEAIHKIMKRYIRKQDP